MADYVTSSVVSSFGHEFAGLSDPTAVDLLVTAASRLFDNLCEVEEDFFAPAPDPVDYTDRDFIGNGTAYLRLLPYTALNDTDPVLMNEGTIEDPSYVSTNLPDYIEREGGLVVLDKTLRTNYDTSYYTGVNRFVGWPDGKQIRVSANWGWTETPADVQLACVHLCYHLWRTADPAFAVISSADGTVRATPIPAVVKATVDKYRAEYSQKALFA